MERNINVELLKITGFEGEDVEKFLPDWEYAAEKCKLSKADIEYAVDEYIPKNWDIQYRGVRKLLGAYIREIIDISKTKLYKQQGKKIVYGILPAVSTIYNALKHAGGNGVYVSFPDLMLVFALNGIFHKASPFFEIAEKAGFTYGCRHCPLNKMRMGAYLDGLLAEPDVIWSWGLNCDEGPKTDEMIQCMTGQKWNYVISRISHDTHFGEQDDETPDRVAYIGDVLQDDFQKIQEITGITVGPEDMKYALDTANRVNFKVGQLSSLACKADPPVLGGNALTQLEHMIAVPFNNGLLYMEEALDIMLKELRQVVKEGKGILPKGSPKVGSYFVPFCIPWIDRLFRENGVATTFSHVLAPSKKQLAPSNYKTEFFKAVAEQFLRMGIIQNMGYEVEIMIEKVNTFKPDGMLMGFFDFDRWLGAHQKMAAKLVEERTGVPHFYMESDFWDDRDYSEEALRTRIESIAHILKMRKGIE